MTHEDREIWKKRVQRWTESGLTAKEYAAEINVNVHTLRGWKWRLGSNRKAAVRQGSGKLCDNSFVEVVTPLANEGAKVKENANSPAADPIELVLPSRVRIRVPDFFDPDSLRRLVDALEDR